MLSDHVGKCLKGRTFDMFEADRNVICTFDRIKENSLDTLNKCPFIIEATSSSTSSKKSRAF